MSQTDLVVLKKGDTLFQTGDPGGDIYIINEGQVEIYQADTMGIETSLNIMKQGEIIGLASVMTREKRLASAKAHTDCVLKKIENAKFKKLIDNLPPWLKTVMKDLTVRLQQMNSTFTATNKTVDQLKKTQISCFFLASQIAGTVAGIGDLISITVDDKKFIVISELREKLETILATDRQIIDKIVDAFLDASLFKMSVEPDQKREVISLENAQAVASFVKFVSDYKGTKLRHLRRAGFMTRHIKFLDSLIRYAKNKKMELGNELSFTQKDLEENLQGSTGQKFEPDILEQAAAVKLLALDGQPDDRLIKFVPRELSMTLTNLGAYRRLEKLDAQLWDSEDKAAA